MFEVIAIDGPSGAGKGTVARAVAKALGWSHVDTGAMYRAVAWLTLHLGSQVDDEERVAQVARSAEFQIDMERIVINGHDVTALIRTPAIDVAAASVARMPRVREELVARQRAYVAAGPVVMEGRDIGTVVFQDAKVKIYLDASPEERASRRAKDPAHDLSRAGEIGVVANALEARDRSDRTRITSPLTRADDAILIDTTGVAVHEVVDQVLEIVRKTPH
jgi:cytidylate kinase